MRKTGQEAKSKTDIFKIGGTMKAMQTNAAARSAKAKALPISRRKFFRSWILFLFALVVLASTAHIAQANEDPKALLESVSNKMITALNDNRDRIKQDPSVTQGLIEEILIPHLDFITASKYVLGNHWDSATKKQKIGFIKAFRKLLLRFYSSALTEYLNSHEGKLDPGIMVFHAPADSNAKQLVLRSEVQPKSGKPVPVNYQMHMTRKGWRVFDVSVEGVSVITTYKTSFASEIQQKGLDALITSIETRNAKLHTANHS
jgi:phospholipid transport system substrate-binding protein